MASLLYVFATTPLVLAQGTLEVSANNDEQQFLADAESLLATGQSDAAYTLLTLRETDLAGNPYYDYLLGVAALDSGRHSDAIFSLRRSLAVAPEYSGAAGYHRPMLSRPLWLRPPPTAQLFRSYP